MRDILLLYALLLAGCATADKHPASTAPSVFERDGEHISAINTEKDTRDDEVSFAIVSDLTGGYREGVFNVAVDVVNKLDVDFVISVGDMIQGFVDEEDAITEEWDVFQRVAAGLKRPLIMTPGNHDIFSTLSRDIWEERFGPTYFAFRRGGYLFIVLNTEDFPDEVLNYGLTDINRRIETLADRNAPGYEMAAASRNALREQILSGQYTYYSEDFDRMIEAGQDMWRRGLIPPSPNPDAAAISEAQHAFLTRTLERHADANWTFIFLHKPIWIGNGAPDFRKLTNALEGRRYTMFAGHLHQYDYREIEGNDHIRLSVTGGGVTQKIQDRELRGTFDHIMHVSIRDSDPVISNIVLDGVLDKAGNAYTDKLEGRP